MFHVSEQAGITRFEPRPSPSDLPGITGDVVFVISGLLLHNYLLPRDCPRITYYASPKTTAADKALFFGQSTADFIMIVESGWYERIRKAILYCYEFLPDNFTLLDECAGYYISYQPVEPLRVARVDNILAALLSRNVELRFTPLLMGIAETVSRSSLNFSNIRLRNARR